MTWISLALLAQFINAIVVLIDRRLVGRRAFDHPAVYAFYVGILSSVVLVLVPFGYIQKPNIAVLALALAYGFTFMFALLFFYRALHRTLATDSAPVFGSLTALATIGLSLLIFPDLLASYTLLAVLFLIIGFLLLSYAHLDKRAIANLIIAGILAGVSSITIKIIFLETSFVDGFFWSRLAQTLAALSFLLVPSFWQSLRERSRSAGRHGQLLTVANKALAGLAMLLILFAIRAGNVAIVNALVSFQFVFLFIISLLHGQRASWRKLVAILIIVIGFFLLFIPSAPSIKKIDYGVSFSTIHTEELGLEWQTVYDAILSDLGVKRLRLSAYWKLVEPKNNIYDFTALDYQIRQAEVHNAKIILAVGRRLPGWPECHEPAWLTGESDRRSELLSYIQTVVKRYANSPALDYWQVENEPYLPVFAKFICGDVDDALYAEERALVRQLDPNHQIIATDGGEFGKWTQAFRAGDIFGTTMYLYIWSPEYGRIRYPIVPEFFVIKYRLVQLLTGQKKPIFIAELGAEPWLLQPIIETPIEQQLERMDIKKFEEILDFARRTQYSPQYLWGVEWWYWMREHGHPEFWSRAKTLFGR